MTRSTYIDVTDEPRFEIMWGKHRSWFPQLPQIVVVCFFNYWSGKMGLSTQILLAGQSQRFYMEVVFLGSKWARESLREVASSHFNPQGNGKERNRALQIAIEKLYSVTENYPDLSSSNSEMGALHTMSLDSHIQRMHDHIQSHAENTGSMFLLTKIPTAWFTKHLPLCNMWCCFDIHDEEMCNASCPRIPPKRSTQV